MQTDPPLIQVEVTAKFQRNLRILPKNYRNIRNDIQPIIERLQSGELHCARIAGVDHTIFKLGVKNSDIQKGKSGGYRLIYYVKTTTIQQILTEFKQQH